MPSVFLERAEPPTDAAVARALGRARPLWDSLRDALAERYAPLTAGWSWSGKAYGWSLRLAAKKRPLLYLIPGDDHFVAAMALGSSAWETARTSRFPKAVLAVLDAAPRFPEGRAVRLPVRTRADLAHVERLVALRAGTSGAAAGARR